jgi:hypothetical protein
MLPGHPVPRGKAVRVARRGGTVAAVEAVARGRPQAGWHPAVPPRATARDGHVATPRGSGAPSGPT